MTHYDDAIELTHGFAATNCWGTAAGKVIGRQIESLLSSEPGSLPGTATLSQGKWLWGVHSICSTNTNQKGNPHSKSHGDVNHWKSPRVVGENYE